MHGWTIHIIESATCWNSYGPHNRRFNRVVGAARDLASSAWEWPRLRVTKTSLRVIRDCVTTLVCVPFRLRAASLHELNDLSGLTCRTEKIEQVASALRMWSMAQTPCSKRCAPVNVKSKRSQFLKVAGPIA